MIFLSYNCNYINLIILKFFFLKHKLLIIKNKLNSLHLIQIWFENISIWALHINIFLMRTIVWRYFLTISQRSFSSIAFNLHWVVPWPIYNVILAINLRYLFSVRESHIIQWKIKRFTNDFWIVNSKAIITYLGPGILIEDFNSTPNSNKFVINWAYSFRIS
jgi:hypothetical protein